MTRTECESSILAYMKDIIEVCKEYNPDANYLSLHFRIMDDGSTIISFNNTFWDKREEYPINVNWLEEKQS